MIHEQRSVKLFLRVALAAGFLSAVADRIGLWSEKAAHGHIAWGHWQSFVQYTGQLVPWVPAAALPAVAWIATILEGILGLLLLVGWKTRWVALLSGLLLLSFALSMSLFTGVKSALDASVFAAAAAAFALATMKDKFLEIG